MINRIDGSPPSPTGKVDNDRNSGPANAATRRDTSVDASLSGDKLLLNQARQAVDRSDGIDRQKVEAIKAAIRNGEYQVDAKRVAAAFVALEMVTGR